MRSILCAVVLSIVCVLSVGQAAAQSVCPKDQPWGCYGSIEIASSSGDEPGVARITYFENGEMLAEIAGATSGERKLLSLRPTEALYFGISDKEVTEGLPFHFFDYAFAYPAMALRAAFPLGPSSMSTAIKDKIVRFDGSEGVLSAERTSATRISYRLVIRDKTKLEMTGYWETAKRLPLPDEHSLAEWKSCTLKRYESVGAARRAIEECPIGGRTDKK